MIRLPVTRERRRLLSEYVKDVLALVSDADLLCRRDHVPESVRISNGPGAESLNPSGRELDMDTWESRRKRGEEDRNLYRGIFYEPPYSVWQAAVGCIVITIGGLLYLWLWGD